MNHTLLSVGTRWGSKETIFVCNETPGESKCRDPLTNHETTANISTELEELGGDQCTRTNKIRMEALTTGNNISADSQFPIYQNPYFTYYLQRGNDYKTG